MKNFANILRRLRRQLSFTLRYFRDPPWDTGISPPELIAFMEIHPAGRALDLGCGTGTNLLALAKAGWQVEGVDFALPAVRAARRRLSKAGVDPARVHFGDVTHLDWAQPSYDLILDIGCYHGLTGPGRQAYRLNLGRLLAAGGSFLLYAHRKSRGAAGVGITEEDIYQLEDEFRLAQRQDGFERAERPSSWLRFVRHETSPRPSPENQGEKTL